MSAVSDSTGTPTASTRSSGAVDHAEDDVEVVDHQVEDDVDLGAALGERRQAMALDEARLR